MTTWEIPARDRRNDRVEKEGSPMTNVGDGRRLKSVLYGFINNVRTIRVWCAKGSRWTVASSGWAQILHLWLRMTNRLKPWGKRILLNRSVLGLGRDPSPWALNVKMVDAGEFAGRLARQSSYRGLSGFQFRPIFRIR